MFIRLYSIKIKTLYHNEYTFVFTHVHFILNFFSALIPPSCVIISFQIPAVHPELLFFPVDKVGQGLYHTRVTTLLLNFEMVTS
jgi:hypothetical protein